MRDGMVDPTAAGLSFSQPKGGLKRGETLAYELKTTEPKDCASQDGEARSKRQRMPSQPKGGEHCAND